MAAFPFFQLSTLRWPGVLQRIALCYLAAWAALRFLGVKGQAGLALPAIGTTLRGLLAGGWLRSERGPAAKTAGLLGGGLTLLLGGLLSCCARWTGAAST